MPDPQQPELRRSERLPATDQAQRQPAKGDEPPHGRPHGTGEGASGGGEGGGVPPDQRSPEEAIR